MMLEALERIGFDVKGYNGLGFKLSPPDLWELALLLLFIALLIFLSSRGSLLITSRRRRSILLLLRGLAVIAIVMALFSPALELEKRVRELPRLILLLDASRSMNLSKGAETRVEAIKRFFRENKALRKLLKKEYNLNVYAFSEGLAAWDEGVIDGNDYPPSDGKATDILRALREAASSTGGPPAAVIIFSDGRDNVSLEEFPENPAGIKKLFDDYPAPVIAFGMGEDENIKDLGIVKVERADYAFIRNAAEITVTVQARGLAGQTFPVILKEEDRIITSKNLTISDENSTAKVTFLFTPERVGQFLYSISVPIYSGDVMTENNLVIFPLKVLRDKIRAMHVCGSPSWDVRFLREALKKDPTIELISFYILREIHDSPLASTKELSLIPFPVDRLFNEDIRTFDLIIFQNFDWRVYLRESYLKNIRDFVMDHGGGFAMIGGRRSFASGSYGGTAMEDILPLKLGKAPLVYASGEYSARLTSAGARHPITALNPDPTLNTSIWEGFPKLDGINPTLGANRSATVLAVHPFMTNEGENMPLIATAEVNRGRTLALATDTLWRWNFVRVGEGDQNREYIRFWRQAARWLVGDPEGKRVKVRTDRQEYLLGQTIRARIRVLDQDYAPAEDARIEAWAILPDKSFPIENVAPVEKEWEGSFTPATPGGWRIKVSAYDRSGQHLGEDETVFTVNEKGKEMINPWPNPQLLKAIAEATGGEFFDISAKKPKPNIPNPRSFRIIGKRDIPLWDNTLALILIALLLSTEWYLRKRWGLS